MENCVLITGASGLLGKALVNKFLEKRFFVFAQYHTRQPIKHKNCRWLWADFSTLEGIRDFLSDNHESLKKCSYLINNFGPITSKPFLQLNSEEIICDFFQNVIPVFEVTKALIKNGVLKSVVNIGFEFLGQEKAYKKIVSYATAKNALLLLTRSFAQEYPSIGFKIIPLPTLDGAQVKAKNTIELLPENAAIDIYKLLTE